MISITIFFCINFDYIFFGLINLLLCSGCDNECFHVYTYRLCEVAQLDCFMCASSILVSFYLLYNTYFVSVTNGSI